ncbi:hypothetical protein OH76DRAFT_584258 [Lentinus brumalis]|uniref:Uncharacterized protein n=1 Tax=Lentinus brumalis TaxID=2498619 RepID=A0A371DTY0_9APHY|nr:hypothetical protein OH76DRAFT_584258 [Polyporus brumalis]
MHLIPPAIVSPVLLCQKLPTPIRVQERSRSQEAPTCTHSPCTIMDGSCGVLGVCVIRLRFGTVFPSCANIVPHSFVQYPTLCIPTSLPAHLSRDRLLATNQFLDPSELKSPAAFVLSYSSRLLYILHHRPRRLPCIPIPLRTVSYCPFSRFLQYHLVNVAASNHPPSLS